MYDYEDLCKILDDAVVMSPAPDYEIKPIKNFDDPHDVHGKVKFVCNKLLFKRTRKECGDLRMSPIGCCQIGSLTGNKLLKVLRNIFNSTKILSGNYLCFAADGILVAAIAISKARMLAITPTPPLSLLDKKFKFLFSKLFDDEEVNTQRKGNYSSLYTKKFIKSLKTQAKSLYPKFLNISATEFLSLSERENVFFYSFFGLLASVAFAGSDKEPLRKFDSNFSSIPFCALTKLAFDSNQSGQITKMFGEIEWQNGLFGKRLYVKRASCSVKTAKLIITK